VSRESRESPALPDPGDRLGLREKSEPRVLRECKDLPVQKVIQVPLVHKGLKVTRETLAREALRESKELPVPLVHKGWPDRKEKSEPRVPRECKDLPVQKVIQVPLARKG
jgi:hypothetical protein